MIYVLSGPNSFLRGVESSRIVDAFVAEHGDLAFERLDGEEVSYDRIRESLESLPFLASKKLVVLRAGSSNKEFLEHAERLLNNLPETTDVVIIEPKLDKRTAYYKYLKKQPGFTEFGDLDENGLAAWLSRETKAAGGSLTIPDARFLIGRVGPNQQLLANELQKLLAYNPVISRQSIELMVDPLPHSSIFDLLDAAFAGRRPAMLKLYAEQRQAKVEAQQIMAMIGWQLHILAIVKTAGDRDPASIAKQAKLNPFVVRKSIALADGLTYAELKIIVREALALDVRLKSESIDTDDAMQHFLLGLAKINHE